MNKVSHTAGQKILCYYCLLQKVETFRLESLRQSFVTDEGSRAETSQLFVSATIKILLTYVNFCMIEA